ncbi:ABC transporter ATP-binding protein [soil metagenome]
MIEADHLTKTYVGRAAVDDISFTVGKGEIVGFLGPNGAGKTTTLRMLTSYLPATSGTVRIAGYNVFTHPIEARHHLGYMPENVPLYDEMRVREYLLFRARLKGLRGSRATRRRCGEVMEMTGLTEVRRKLIGNLSKGFRQRVGLADALVANPDLLILDEPTNGLDPNQIRSVRSLIRELGKNHTILLSTHILHEVEMTCDRVLIISRGKLKASGSPAELVANLRSAGTMAVEMQAPPATAAAKIQKLEGVRKIHHNHLENGWCRLVIRVESGADLREPIARLAADSGYTVRELYRKAASLEDVFVELTQDDT